MSSTPCRLCGGTVRPHLKVRGCDLFVCNDCGFIQVDPVPSADALGSLYSKAYFEKGKYRNDEAGRREQRRRLELLDRMGIPKGAKILDYGCATGEFVSAAAKRYEVWGADISVDALAETGRRVPQSVDRLVKTEVDGRLPKGGLPIFDAIVAWDVLEHLVDPGGVLEDLAQVLRPGGILIASTPDIGAPVARAMGKRWAFMTPPEHLGFFSHRVVRRCFEKVGLSPEMAFSRGKWANLGFIFYKLRRVFPAVPDALIRFLGGSALGRLCLYVPTQDVLYIAGRKRSLDRQY